MIVEEADAERAVNGLPKNEPEVVESDVQPQCRQTSANGLGAHVGGEHLIGVSTTEGAVQQPRADAGSQPQVPSAFPSLPFG